MMCVMMSGGMHTTVLYLLSCCVFIAFIEDVNSLRSSLCSHKSINKIIINKSNKAKLTRNKFNIHQLFNDDYVDRETALYEYEKITNRPSRIDYSKDQELSKMLTLGTTMYDDNDDDSDEDDDDDSDEDDDDDDDGCNDDEDDSYDEDEVVLMVVIPMIVMMELI